MRHHKNKGKLGRETGVRTALMRNLATSLFTYEKISTSEAKAKYLRPFAEKLITTAKADTATARRLVAAKMGTTTALKQLFTEIAPRYANRRGGYTRIIKLGSRLSDGSRRARIELVK